MEHWWNDTDRGKPETVAENPVAVSFVHHKPHMD
jgi:hypothetical protein